MDDDGIDNDGDGLVDESWTDGIDNDGDWDPDLDDVGVGRDSRDGEMLVKAMVFQPRVISLTSPSLESPILSLRI